MSLGYVPPFRSAERSRAWLGFSGRAWIGERVLLGAAWSLLRDQTKDDEVDLGAGDLHLGTVLEVLRYNGLHVYGGWAVKLPNAADEGELGTDETDVTFGGGVGWERGQWRLVSTLGLGVWGNPLKFANQDDVPLLRLSGAWDGGALALGPTFAADLSTSRNPARVRAGGVVRLGEKVFAQVEGLAGLTPAEGDWQVGIAAGWRADLPAEGGRE